MLDLIATPFPIQLDDIWGMGVKAEGRAPIHLPGSVHPGKNLRSLKSICDYIMRRIVFLPLGHRG